MGDRGAESSGGGRDYGDFDEERAERLPPKTTRELPAGSVVSVRTPGGGGYGEPGERDLAAIARDVRLGKVSVERVEEEYGMSPEEVDLERD